MDKETRKQISFDQLLKAKELALEAIRRDQVELAEIEVEIADRLEPFHKAARELEGKESGSVNFNALGYRVKSEVPKTVTWNDDQLANIAENIRLSGDEPTRWMEQKWRITERKFAAWPKDIQKVFGEARSVKYGKPKFEVVLCH